MILSLRHLGFFIALLLYRPEAASFDHILTFWIKPFPRVNYEPDSFKINPFMPVQSLDSLIAQHNVWQTAGIIVLYGGYINVSDPHGQVTFPVMQQNYNFMLIVTQHMRPIFMLGNTIHHWELLPQAAARCYTITRQQDAQTQLYFWNVEETSKPETLIVPLTAIVVCIDPTAIMVPSGITITSSQPQLVLPSIYLLNKPDLVKPALSNLKVKGFFGSVKSTFKNQKENYYARQIKVNTSTL